jgi:DNA invertase Pin-like site-specific DNA recombinase
LPEQRQQLERYCAELGWELVNIFEDARSGTNGERPALKAMLAAAHDPQHPVDVILATSYCRLYRNFKKSVLTIHELEESNVEFVAVLEPVPDNEDGHLLKILQQHFAERFSRRIGRETKRGMLQNARNGFFNGSIAPYGYRAVAVGQKGHRTKKKLEIEPVEAEVVRSVYDWYEFGNGDGPMGIKRIVNHLNEQSIRTRRGSRFSVKTVHEILSSSTYAGEHWFNRRDSRTNKLNDKANWIATPVPAIVPRSRFDRVQQRLTQRRPNRTPPRLSGNSRPLSGLVYCGQCGNRLTVSTSKGGAYTYYRCAGQMCQGDSKCSGTSIRLDRLESIVIAETARRLMSPDRLRLIVDRMVAALNVPDVDPRKRHRVLKAELDGVQTKLRRLYEQDAGREGNARRTTLVELIRDLETREDVLNREIARLADEIAQPKIGVTPVAANRLGQGIQQRLLAGDQSFQRAYLQLVLGRITVGRSTISISARNVDGGVQRVQAGSRKMAA